MSSLASIFPVVHNFLFFEEPRLCQLSAGYLLCYSYAIHWYSCFFSSPAVQVRLVNGSSDREGRVEVFYNGEWGTVCDDYFDIRDANVICRMMGFPAAVSAEIGGHFGAGNSSQRVLLDDLWCRGNESSVASCSFRAWGSHDCSHTEDAGVVCQERLPGTEDG